jgi:DNA polymerase III epsilon subunit-like protein
MTDVMIDLETFSTKCNASILTIGAIKFNRKGHLPPLKELDTFYCRIDKESCKAIKLHFDPKVISWWEKQDDDCKYEVFTNEGRIHIRNALKDFAKWIGPNKKIWGHGSVFDCAILNNAYYECGLETPWDFWNIRDTRTIYDIGKVKLSDIPNNRKHHALHDAYRQIIGVKIALDNLEKNI